MGIPTTGCPQGTFTSCVTASNGAPSSCSCTSVSTLSGLRAAQRKQYDGDAWIALEAQADAKDIAVQESYINGFADGRNVRQMHPPLFGLGGTHLEGEAARLRDRQLPAIEKSRTRGMQLGAPLGQGVTRAQTIAIIDTYLRAMRESE